jgi:hypothetical protein
MNCDKCPKMPIDKWLCEVRGLRAKLEVMSGTEGDFNNKIIDYIFKSFSDEEKEELRSKL